MKSQKSIQVKSKKQKGKIGNKTEPIGYNSFYEVLRIIFILNFHDRLRRAKYRQSNSIDKSQIRNPKFEIACFGRAFYERRLIELSGG
jgi:hypothetical protein